MIESKLMLAGRGEQTKTPEAPLAIKPFSGEAIEFLGKKGLLHCPLNGQSVKTQQLDSMPFWHISNVKKNF